jgi:hypothetical protein
MAIIRGHLRESGQPVEISKEENDGSDKLDEVR